MNRGRRPKSDVDTRKKIITVAIDNFANLGYDRASMRTIAKNADVDPSLLYHYFGSKEELFVEVMRDMIDSDEVVQLDEEHLNGVRIVKKFLVMLRMGPNPFVGLLQSAFSNKKAKSLVKTAIRRVIIPHVESSVKSTDYDLLVSLVATQLFGLIMVKDVLELEPFNSMSDEEIAQQLGPTITMYLQSNENLYSRLMESERDISTDTKEV